MGKHVVGTAILDVQRRRAPSKHYVYVIEVEWSDGSKVVIYRRYSQFFEFHTSLLDLFPKDAGENPGEQPRIIPFLPGKKLFGRSHTHRVAQARAKAINEYLKVLVSLPERISHSSHVLDFFEANELDIKPPSAEEREKRPSNIIQRVITGDSDEGKQREINVGDVMVLDQYRAVADYTKQDKKELSFKAGDIFEVIEKNDNGWWFVTKDSETTGWVPATFLEPLEDPDDEEVHSNAIPGNDEKYISTNKFEAKNKDEIGFDKGVVVTVLEKKLDGWWRVNYQSQTGWAPGSYLKRLEVQEYQPSGVLGGTAAPVKPAKPAAVPITADGQVKLRKKDGQDKPPPQRRESISRPDSIHGDKGAFAKAAAAAVKAGAGAKIPTDNNKKAEPEPGPDDYITLAAFEKQDSTGVSFAADVHVTVLERTDTGWYYVQLPTGEEGWAPSDFLAPRTKNSASQKPSKPAKPEPVAAAKPIKPAAEPKPALEFKPKPAAEKPQPSGASRATVAGGKSEPAAAAALAAAMVNTAKSSAADKPTAASRSATAAVIKKKSGDGAGNSSIAEKQAALAGVLNGGASKPAVVASKPSVSVKPAVAASKPSVSVKPAVAASKPALSTSSSMAEPSGEKFVVISDFTADNDSSVSVKTGEFVYVDEKSDTGWFYVKKTDGTEGWAPSDYLKPAAGAKPTPAAKKPAVKADKPGKPTLKENEYLALEDYQAGGSEEVSLKAGEVVEVAEKTEGWWFCIRKDKSEGWAPSDFLSKSR